MNLAIYADLATMYVSIVADRDHGSLDQTHPLTCAATAAYFLTFERREAAEMSHLSPVITVRHSAITPHSTRAAARLLLGAFCLSVQKKKSQKLTSCRSRSRLGLIWPTRTPKAAGTRTEHPRKVKYSLSHFVSEHPHKVQLTEAYNMATPFDVGLMHEHGVRCVCLKNATVPRRTLLKNETFLCRTILDTHASLSSLPRAPGAFRLCLQQQQHGNTL